MINKCKKCGKEISNKRKYCSQNCYKSTLKGKGNPMFGVNRKGKCFWMKEVNKKRKGLKLPPRSEESKKRNSEAIKKYYLTHEHPGIKKFTSKQVANIIRLYTLEGYSFNVIAKRLGCSSSVIKRVIIENKIPQRKPLHLNQLSEARKNTLKINKVYVKIPPKKLNYIIKNFSDETNAHLSKKLGFSESQISYIASKHNLKKSSEHRKKMRRIVGKKTYQRGLGIGGMLKEERIRIGKIAYSRGIAKMSPEEISEIGKKGAKASYKKVVKEGKLPAMKERMRNMAKARFQKLKKEGKFLEFQKRARLQIPKRDTTIELAIKRGLEERGYRFIEMEEILNEKISPKTIISQYSFEDSFWIDFAMPQLKLAIECLGDWHHANPDIYNKKEKLHHIQIKGMERDKKRKKVLESKNWRVLMIWGKDIRENLKDCLDMIEKEIKKLKSK